MPTCPYCDVEIDEDVDMTDWGNYDCKIKKLHFKNVILYYIGTCRKCHRSFKWKEKYTWTEDFDEFEEIAP